MGTAKLPTGVEIRRDKIYIWFRWDGKRYYEPFGQNSQANLKRAAKLRTQITTLIETGAFDDDMYHTYFPNSKALENRDRTFRFFDLCQKYLDGLEVDPETRNDYRKSLMRCWVPYWADRDIRGLKLSEIKQAIIKNNYNTARTRNNTLVPLRGVFKMALLDRLIVENPMVHIENAKENKGHKADPLTLQERDKVLAWIKENEHAIFSHYFTASFAMGARQPSEMSALHWKNVDFNACEVFIDRRITGGKLKMGTKTGKDRTVKLRPQDMDAFKSMREYTGFDGDFVFKSPQGNPFFSPNRNLNKVWNRALKACGIRHHEMTQTRHTAATTWIMAGMRDKFVASQLGDSVAMVQTHYAKWLDEQGTDDELAKMDAYETRIANKLRTESKG